MAQNDGRERWVDWVGNVISDPVGAWQRATGEQTVTDGAYTGTLGSFGAINNIFASVLYFFSNIGTAIQRFSEGMPLADVARSFAEDQQRNDDVQRDHRERYPTGHGPNAPGGTGGSAPGTGPDGGITITGNPTADATITTAGGAVIGGGAAALTAGTVRATAAPILGLAARAPMLEGAVAALRSMGTKGKIAAILLGTAAGGLLGSTLASNAAVDPNAAVTNPAAAITADVGGSITATPEAEPELSAERATGLFMDGVYEESINLLSAPGYVVDGSAWLINQPLGWLGWGQIEDPFLGHDSIQGGLTSLYNGYAETFAPSLLAEPQNGTELAISLAGGVTGDVLAAVATGGTTTALAFTTSAAGSMMSGDNEQPEEDTPAARTVVPTTLAGGPN